MTINIHSIWRVFGRGLSSLYILQVVRTVCVERQRVEDFETCAFSFTLKVVVVVVVVVEVVVVV